MNKRKIILIIIFILVLVAIPNFPDIHINQILEYEPSNPIYAAIIIIGLYLIKPIIIFIPLNVLSLSAGLLFSPAIAIVITFTGLFFTTTISYNIGKKIGRKRLDKIINKNDKIKNFLSKKNINPNVSCFIGRLLPLPFDIMSMFYGASGIKYPIYIMCTFFGLVPFTLSYIFMGDAVRQPFSKEFFIPLTINIILTTITLVVSHILQRNKTNGIYTDSSEEFKHREIL